MPITPSVQQDFLDLVDRVTPESFILPLKNVGPGYEAFQADAQVKARVSLAISRLDLVAFIQDAPAGAFATATVSLTRAAGGAAMTVKAGSVFTTSNGGRDFVLVTDVPFAMNDAGPHTATVQAVRRSYQWNVPGPVTTASGQVLPGDIDTIKNLIEDPVFSDTTVQMTQTTDATGGAPPALAQLGADRAITQNPGESTLQFRQRIRQLPDTVSPAAIKRALTNFFAPFPGVSFDFIETWQPTYQEAFDCPSPNPGTPTFLATIPTTIDTNLFVFDDTRPAYPPFRNRWLDENDYRGAFIVTVPNLAAISDYGMAYDDTAETPAALTTVNGKRSVNAYDVPRSNFPGELQGAFDGFDTGKASVYKGLFDTLEAIKGGGVTIEIVLQGT